ncbi:MAG: phage tail protein [Bradyrhizobium sp.]
MNVNGSRFHLLLGEADWGRCRVRLGNDAWHRLADGWSSATPPVITSPVTDTSPPLVVDAWRDELRLQREPITLGATSGETPLALDARRTADADRYGNIYWIDGDRRRLRVWSVGSDRESAFWPDGPLDCSPAHSATRSDFAPISAATPVERTFHALAVTDDHYLVVAFIAAASKGLIAFDLMAGGPPVETLWPQPVPFAPFDMVRRCGGGVWVLDRENARLWELDRRLAVVGRAQSETTLAPPEADLFQPTSGAQRLQPAALFPNGIDLRAVAPASIDPIAVEALEGGVLVLDRNQGAGRSRVFRLLRAGDAIAVDPPFWLDHLAHDFVLAEATTKDGTGSVAQLLVATDSGNQALAFVVGSQAEMFRLRAAVELFPLRRFGGRALLNVRGVAWYDSGFPGLRWVPIVQQPRVRYRESGELVTPVFDGGELQCVWDRLMLDACIAADSRIEIWCRASDERIRSADPSSGAADADEAIGAWRAQPSPYLRGDGAELPWVRAQAVRPPRRETGTGTWELLLQGARGRYLQLRLLLSGNGTATPWLRALRVWYPRFSYPQRFLPGVFREDPASADFLERFLANVEGINTKLEGNIAQVQALIDPQSAPAETLAWLAEWFDVALDPTWDEQRRRLFVKHAMTFFRWRGTVHGLRMALTLAFETCIDEGAFHDPDPSCVCQQSVRIVESYLTRRIGALAAGDPGAAESGPRTISKQSLWSPQEGNAGLAERYAQRLGRTATPAEQVTSFALIPPSDPQQQEDWRSFAELTLGFVPRAGADERVRWQTFLQARYDLDTLRARHATRYASFGAVDLPADWARVAAAAEDWRAYCALPTDTRVRERWQDFLARRYRRIERLNAAYHTSWPSFDVVALPDHLPATTPAQADWLQFERQLLAMARTAHRFSVLLPMTSVTEDPFEMQRRLQLARRVVELEKPAHTVFDVRFYWALNRIGEARLGLDTLLDVGSRAPQLLPDAVLGRAYVGESFVGGAKPPTDGDRRLLAC